MEDIEFIADKLQDYGIIENEDDSYDLASDIIEDVKNSKMRKVKDSVADYLIQVYDMDEDEVSDMDLESDIARIFLEYSDFVYGASDIDEE